MKSLSLILSSSFLAGCLASWPALAKEVDTRPIASDVEILRGILASAIGKEGKRRHDWFDADQIRTWYLAGQGVVFRVDTDQFREHGGTMYHFEAHQEAMEASWEAASEAMEQAMESLHAQGLDMDVPEPAMPAEPPEPPEPAIAYSIRIGDSDKAASEAERKAMRELSESVRAKSRELRAKAKELRKLGDEEKSAAARAALEKDIDKIKDELAAVRDKQRQTINAQKAKAEAAWGTTLAGLESKLITALCNYGGSLKSLPKDEHVSLILDDAVKGEEGREDLYYVFSRKDLSDCQAERLSVAQLKDKAARYTY